MISVVVRPQDIMEIEVNLMPEPDAKPVFRDSTGRKLFINFHGWNGTREGYAWEIYYWVRQVPNARRMLVFVPTSLVGTDLALGYKNLQVVTFPATLRA